MAPTAPAPSKRPTARQKARARLADPLLPRKLHRENNVVTDSFIDSKQDRRLIKHSAFLSRVATSSGKGGNGKIKKRRRPNKKLVATLESLGDALDDIRAEIDEEDAAEQVDSDGEAVMDEEQARQGKVRHKSLKSRPGALKRKEKLVRGEMERFGKSLAQLAKISSASAPLAPAPSPKSGSTTVSPSRKARRGNAGVDQDKVDTEDGEGNEAPPEAQSGAPGNRWAALRGFISATMEQNPAFLGKT
ncbi:ribosome biogenesis protein SLX9-domain-containing protein [Chaetomium sp. MPI-SDFR-AT-0129]|nr:ribosome biogenesis protein SLX9-domain-containing protein [Chaetomium sp. MPI-SDFR-AT-0129]